MSNRIADVTPYIIVRIHESRLRSSNEGSHINWRIIFISPHLRTNGLMSSMYPVCSSMRLTYQIGQHDWQLRQPPVVSGNKNRCDNGRRRNTKICTFSNCFLSQYGSTFRNIGRKTQRGGRFEWMLMLLCRSSIKLYSALLSNQSNLLVALTRCDCGFDLELLIKIADTNTEITCN